MKPITLAFFTALAGFATTAARADSRVNVDVGIAIGAPAPTVVHAPAYGYTPSRGHWEHVTVKTWIPGRWVTGRDRWGRPVRMFEKGYYTYRTDRVWVAHDGHRDHDGRRDRDGGRYGYGYRGGRNG